VEEPRVLVLSNYFILVFEPEQKQLSTGYYCTLSTCIGLNKIKRFRRNIKFSSIIGIDWTFKEPEVF